MKTVRVDTHSSGKEVATIADKKGRLSHTLRRKNVCDACGIDVIFNLDIYKLTGMCGACSTGEARLNYEED